MKFNIQARRERERERERELIVPPNHATFNLPYNIDVATDSQSEFLCIYVCW
jgi:hypothetical protein